MEAMRLRREQTITSKREVAQQLQEQRSLRTAYIWPTSNGTRWWFDSAAMERRTSHWEKILRLLEVVLRNAATKSDPKYKLLNASNHNLWMRLLQFQEVVLILVEEGGFERSIIGSEKRKETEALRIAMERDRINLTLNNADAIASLVADLDALDIASAKQQWKKMMMTEILSFAMLVLERNLGSFASCGNMVIASMEDAAE